MRRYLGSRKRKTEMPASCSASIAVVISRYGVPGFAATTTRMIAERVGIRQATLYYYFDNKHSILMELLTTSVRPSLEAARRIEALFPTRASAAAALYSQARELVEGLSSTRKQEGDVIDLRDEIMKRFEVPAAQKL